MQKSIEKFYVGPRDVRPLAMSAKDVEDYMALDSLGIGFPEARVRQMVEAFGMDATNQAMVTTASVPSPVQFLQTWMPGVVRILTGARKIDELVGVTTAGNWEDEEIVQTVIESIGNAVPYGDDTNVPLASWNPIYERRSVFRAEKGFHVGKLEEARAARMNVSSSNEKRNAVSLTLEIQRNLVGFNGYNSGNNRIYGFLNDPALPAYVTVATGAASSTLWSSKTFLEITADIRTAFAALQTQSQDNIGMDAPITLAVSTAAAAYLSVTPVYGNGSVRTWFNETFPNGRIVSAPQLNAANGGANVAYLYAETIDDGSTDNNRVFDQIVPAKIMLTGVENKAKGYTESYTNATAGIFCKRPYGVTRMSGL